METTYLPVDAQIPPATLTGPASRKALAMVAQVDFENLVAFGMIPYWKNVVHLSFADNVNNTEITVSPLNAFIPFPTAGIRLEAVSASASDAAAGTGVRTVLLRYLDTSYVSHDEIMTLNGVTPVLTTATNIFRIQRLSTLTAGTGLAAAGNITLRLAGGGQSYAQIRAGRNASDSGVYTIPAGTTGWITSLHASVAVPNSTLCADVRCTMSLDDLGNVTPGIMRTHDILTLVDGDAMVHYPAPITIPPKTDIRLTAIATAANAAAHISGRWTFLLYTPA